jgi:hypothetical protein
MGRTKLTLDVFQRLAEEKGGRCLSAEYKNTKAYLKWKCAVAEHSEWEATGDAIRNQKQWCAACAGRPALTIADAHKLAEAKGGRCLSEVYVNNAGDLEWQCDVDEKHTWFTCYACVKSGHWCPHCAGNARLTLEEMKKIAIKRGGVLVSTEYKNSKEDLIWRCDKKHQWPCNADGIRAGQWCPKCAPNAIRTLEDMQKIAAKRKGFCLSKVYTCQAKNGMEVCRKSYLESRARRYRFRPMVSHVRRP